MIVIFLPRLLSREPRFFGIRTFDKRETNSLICFRQSTLWVAKWHLSDPLQRGLEGVGQDAI